MHTGMLWFSKDTNQLLEDRINEAVAYYEKKYGRKPNLCFVHPSALENRPGVRSFTIGKLTVRAYRPVLPGHIWIGIEDKAEA